jgi:lantibiotic biosynthesis protein
VIMISCTVHWACTWPMSSFRRPASGAGYAVRWQDLSVSPSEGHIAWESKHPQTGVPEINLGLAHGIPSVLLALSRFANDSKSSALLSRGVDYLLSCRLQDSANGSLFPHRMAGGMPDQPGRLAWCYGDPGVGAALWQIGMRANRPDWQTDAIGILHKAASRRETTVNRVTDACVCHGTAGLALLFYKMAILSEHDEFLDAASHWTLATLDHGQNPAAAAGYLFLTTGDRYISSHSLLEGITGVGLTLLALLDADTLGWEQGLLI